MDNSILVKRRVLPDSGQVIVLTRFGPVHDGLLQTPPDGDNKCPPVILPPLRHPAWPTTITTAVLLNKKSCWTMKSSIWGQGVPQL